ncbi:nuclease [Fragilaria crotonensis]|nr:nuclease [Fragilaria crotonensis]
MSLIPALDDDSDDEFDDDNEDTLLLMLAAASYLLEDKQTRAAKWQHTRICWDQHVVQLRHEQLFERMYRMSNNAFVALQRILGRRIVLIAYHSPGVMPIPPEIVMATGLRWLSGCPSLDLHISMGMSLSSVYRCRDIFFDAVNAAPELAIAFPQSAEELDLVSSQFESRSLNQLMRGCVGCIDGYLAVTVKPSMADSGHNPGAFRSGHYGVYGLNVQAVCDYRSRFNFFAVAAPGKCADQLAFERTSLPALMEALPIGKYLVGDAAYSVSEKMLVPFTGSQRSNANNDAYNFCLSQLRIRIEMAFGLMSNKWRVLRTPLQTSLKMSAITLECCSKLHNFCINQDGDQFVDDAVALREILPMPGADLGWGYLPTVEPLVHIPGTSQMRDIIVRRVANLAIRRPAENLERHRYELHDIDLM